MNNYINIIINFIKNVFNNYSDFITKHRLLHFLPKNLLIFVISIILIMISSISFFEDDYVINKRITVLNGVYGEIYDRSVKQDIDIKKIEKIEKFGIKFATYARKNTAKYKLVFYKDKEIIKQYNLSSEKIADNKDKFFNLNLKKIDKNSKYSFELIPIDATKDNSITMYKDNEDIGYIIVNKSEFYKTNIVLYILFAFVFLIINIIINKGIIKSEKNYFLLMLIYIIPILFLIPAFEIPDEPYHFYKSYKVSQYSFTNTPNYNMSKKKLKVPKNINCLYYAFSYNENVTNKNNLNNCFKNESNIYKKEKNAKSSNRLFIAIPGAIGIKIADILTNSPMIIFYTGRLFVLLASILILLHALKVTPKYKKIFLIIMCIPMFIHQMVSYSYDSLLDSMCILLCAYLIKFFEGKNISNKDLIMYTILTVMITVIKLPYVLLGVPILFINKEKFGNKKYTKIIKSIIYLLVIMFMYKLVICIDNIGIKNTTKSVIGTSKNTISDLIRNPKYTIMLILRTMKYNGPDYFNSMIGNFGWLHYPLSNQFVFTYYMFIIALIMSEKNDFSKKIKMGCLFLILIIIGGIFLALFLDWTPHLGKVIEGVQGRYFLPLLPIVFIMLIPKNNKISIKDRTIYNFINLSMFIFIIKIIASFY